MEEKSIFGEIIKTRLKEDKTIDFESLEKNLKGSSVIKNEMTILESLIGIENIIDCFFKIYDGISNDEINILNELKYAIDKELSDSKNYCYICNWIIDIIKFNLIDVFELGNEENSLNVLKWINHRYLEYVLTKLLCKGKEFMTIVIEYICEYYIGDNIYIESMDMILDFVYYRYKDFKISKESVLNLIKFGSKYTSKFISEYDFTKVEIENVRARTIKISDREM